MKMYANNGRTKTYRFPAVLLAGLLCIVLAAYAAIRRPYSDREVVSRAELIVVGRLKEGSIVLVLHAANTNMPSSRKDPLSPDDRAPTWEHHLQLVVSEVLKGQVSTTSMVVSVEYGLDPLVGGCFSNQFHMIKLGDTNYAKDVVQIFDTGSSTRPLRSITGDIRTNHIWLLRYARAANSDRGKNSASDIICVFDPEDIQPIARRDELLKHLE